MLLSIRKSYATLKSRARRWAAGGAAGTVAGGAAGRAAGSAVAGALASRQAAKAVAAGIARRVGWVMIGSGRIVVRDLVWDWVRDSIRGSLQPSCHGHRFNPIKDLGGARVTVVRMRVLGGVRKPVVPDDAEGQHLRVQQLSADAEHPRRFRSVAPRLLQRLGDHPAFQPLHGGGQREPLGGGSHMAVGTLRP